MKIKLFGKKTDSIFDAFSFAHIFIWFLITRHILKKIKFPVALMSMLAIGLGFELLENELEDVKNKTIRKYYKKKEHWANRYIGDIFSNVVGFFIAYKYDSDY